MSVPRPFKDVGRYAKRGLELYRAQPIVSYFCMCYQGYQASNIGYQYATQMGLAIFKKMPPKDPERKYCREYLGRLMDRLEDLKKSTTIPGKKEAVKFCGDFADSVFSGADDEDRAGSATQQTAKRFYTAGMFYDILEQFDEAAIPYAEKRKYAKYKAADIMKALKEGRVPLAGPPEDWKEEEEKEEDAPPPAYAPKEILPDPPVVRSTEPPPRLEVEQTPVVAPPPGAYPVEVAPSYPGTESVPAYPTAPPEPLPAYPTAPPEPLPAYPTAPPEPLPAYPTAPPEPQYPPTAPYVAPSVDHSLEERKAALEREREQLAREREQWDRFHREQERMRKMQEPVAPSMPYRDDVGTPMHPLPRAIQDQARKHCKFAASALNFNDPKTALLELTRAKHLLITGTPLE